MNEKHRARKRIPAYRQRKTCQGLRLRQLALADFERDQIVLILKTRRDGTCAEFTDACNAAAKVLRL